MRIIYIFTFSILLCVACLFLLSESEQDEVAQPKVVQTEKEGQIGYRTDNSQAAEGYAATGSKVISISELQQQYDDYYTLALELLHRARAGDGNSQFALANLLVFCQVNVLADNFELLTFAQNNIDILLSQGISDNEAELLHTSITDLKKCEQFRNTDLKFFDDNNFTNEQMLERTTYWVKKAFENNVPDAAFYLFGLHLSEVINLSEAELKKATMMIRGNIAHPTFSALMSLQHLSSYENSSAVMWALSQEPGFLRSNEGWAFKSNLAVLDCIKVRVFVSSDTRPDYDCAENVQRYGVWLRPELIPEVEAEVERIKQAWSKGDYAGAGFEALVPFLENAPSVTE